MGYLDQTAEAAVTLMAHFWDSPPAQMWLAFLLIGLAIEMFLNAENGQPVRNILLNVRYSFIYLCIIFVLSPSLGVAVGQLSGVLGAGWINVDVFPRDKLLGQVGAAVTWMVVLDFFYYWWHRAQHSFQWLWDQHTVHHSDESLNVSTSVRHHWSEFIFQGLVISVPMTVLFKLTPIEIWTISTVTSAWAWFIHMNIRLHLGPLSWVISGPQNHRIHHSRLPQHFDKNFAAYTPVWDVLFGTYYAPARDEYPPTGIDGVRIDTAREAAIYPFRKWATKLARMAPAVAVRRIPNR